MKLHPSTGDFLQMFKTYVTSFCLNVFLNCMFFIELSEEKAKLLRKVGGTIEEKDQLLTAFLSSLQLEYLHCYSEPNQLPQVHLN